MEFTPRISQILKILLANGTPIGKQEIAEELGVSKRTVQREFEYLELCIRKYNLKLVNYKGKGVILEGKVEDLVKLEENLREEQYPDAADRDGRRRRLLFELLRDRTPRKLFYYSQMLGVSEATAGSDMDALRDPDLLPDIRSAMLESASALEKKYGFAHEDLVNYMETMMIKRFTTPGVVDPIARVSREPIRKISPNDRIMGPAYQCEEYGLDNFHLLKGVACALKFKADDDPQADELQKFIAENGVEAAIVKYTGVAEGSRMYNVILEEYKKLA